MVEVEVKATSELRNEIPRCIAGTIGGKPAHGSSSMTCASAIRPEGLHFDRPLGCRAFRVEQSAKGSGTARLTLSSRSPDEENNTGVGVDAIDGTPAEGSCAPV